MLNQVRDKVKYGCFRYDPPHTLIIKRKANWKVAFLLGKSVAR